MFINDSGERNLSKKFTKIDALDAVPDFRILSKEYLRSLTFGVYKKQAFSYTTEHFDEVGICYFCRGNHAKYNTGENTNL